MTYLVDWRSFLALLIPVPALIVANLAVRHRWAHIVTLAGLSVTTGSVLIYGGVSLASHPLPSGHDAAAAKAAYSLFIAALLAGLCLLPFVRAALARVLPIDPASPLVTFALVAFFLILGFQVSYQFQEDALAQVGGGAPLDRYDVILQELPLVIGAALGVGLLIRRGLGGTAARLGVLRPAWWHLAVALAAAGLFYAFGFGADVVQRDFFPVVASRLDQATAHYYSGLNDPAGIAIIAVSAGVAEELFFRGALQPRLGIILTALLFASLHSQYALTIDTGVVFVLGCGLGLLRRQFSTTVSVLAHVAYNSVVGIGITAALLVPAAAVEIVAVVVAGVGFWMARAAARRRLNP